MTQASSAQSQLTHLNHELHKSQQQHQALDLQIEKIAQQPAQDEQQIAQMKKEKLHLKDKINDIQKKIDDIAASSG